MSIDNTKNRETSNLCQVVSKYFSYNPVMDECSKKNKKDLQNNSKNQETKTNKAQKRPRKRAQGQKDIRTLIKKKKNELVSYSKDFESICKQSGIDVDPEQLQLAIALSKSLQDLEGVSDDGLKTAKSLTSNQRKGKIRTTLQEYGFKIPEIKANIGKKVKRYRKHYKLLLVSDSEKQQIIADKFAQILFRNVSTCSINDNSLFKLNNTDSFLYNLSTNVTYECIKNEDIFYVPDLIQKTSNERHHMLRDWSQIPGRPASPKIELSDISFNSIECSQEELAKILSGTIQTAQDIVKRNYKENFPNQMNVEEIDTNTKKFATNTSVPELKITHQKLVENELLKEKSHEIDSENSTSIGYSIGNFIHSTSCKDTQNMTTPTNRSHSPDIFDDEVTVIMDNSKDTVAVQDEVTEKTMVRERDDFMDLTECVNIVNYNNTNFKHNLCLSQGNNKTTIKPNDFMELTACVMVSSQQKFNDIQIASHSGKENNNPNIFESNCHAEIMDLTQSSNSNNSFPNIDKDDCVNKSLEDDTIIIIEEEYCNTNVDGLPVTLASTETDLIDLVSGQYNNHKISKNVPEHDSVIDLAESPENNENKAKDLNFEYGKQLNNSDNNFPRNISEHLGQSKESEGLEYNKNTGAIDLTQDSKFEDDLSCVNSNNKTSSTDIITNHGHEKDIGIQDLLEDKLNSLENVNCNYYNECGSEIHLSKCEEVTKKPIDCPDFQNYENDHRSDDLINDVPRSPFRYSDKSDTGNDYTSRNKNLEAVDLIQSSNSEDGIKNIHRSIDDSNANRSMASNVTLIDCSHDDTILLNDNDYCSNSLLCNEINFVEIKDKITSSNNPNENSKYSNTRREQKSVFDFDNDREFDNLLVSKRKQSGQTSKSSDKDKYLNDENNFNFENEDDIQNREIDLAQHSDYSDEKENDHDGENYNIQNHEIDLTQHSDCSNDNVYRSPIESGKMNNVSIDYDEVYLASNNRRDCNIIFEGPTTKHNKEKGNCSKDDVLSSSSQYSEVFEISDNEFNYSVHQHKQDTDSIRSNQTKFDIGGMSIINEFLNRNSLSTKKDKLRCSCANLESNFDANRDQSCLPEDVVECNNDVLDDNEKKSKPCTEFDSVKISTPSKSKNNDDVLFAKTPKHSDYIIKTDQVTPMPKYEMMTSPERIQELDKYGIKPLKRKKAIQILTHIYNQTHPVMEVVSDSEACFSPLKIRRKNDLASFPRRAILNQIDSVMPENYTQLPGSSIQHSELGLSQESSKSHKGLSKKSKTSPTKSYLSPEYSKNSSNGNNLYEETKQLPDIRNIECCSEEWVFQKREKAKVYSCRVPLHIAFHNYVSCRRGLREAILRYEPINIDDIHKGLVAIGYRYNPKDLLKFMDKKCITVKTADNPKINKK